MALITCPECSKEVSDKAAACPHCGARRARKSYLFPVLLCILVATPIAVSLGIERGWIPSYWKATQPVVRREPEALTEWESNLFYNQEALFSYAFNAKGALAGTFTNESRFPMGYVAVEFHLIDKENRIIGQAMDSIRNLKPGQVWAFEASVYPKGVARARFSKATFLK